MDNLRILLADSDTSFVNECAVFLSENGFAAIDVLREYCNFDEVYSGEYDCAIVEMRDLMKYPAPAPLQNSFDKIILTCRRHTIETELFARSLRPAVYLVKPVAFVDILSVLLRIIEIKNQRMLKRALAVRSRRELRV